MEYEVVDVSDAAAAIALTLCVRSAICRATIWRRGRPVTPGPPVATPAAQCLGGHRFEMAFQPHGPAPASGAMFASARAVNVPPCVVSARKIGGDAAFTRSLITVKTSGGAAILSALKKAEESDAVIVRLFNPDDLEADVHIETTTPIAAAYAVNLLEERQQALAPGTSVHVRLKPHEIRTIELT